ncbi:C4-type zinc ribbon domain-containing protein [Saccharopolyspora sp. TS4A08]|uniref:C4-type zinc ribbon domain-containing protein n=1 Tax=Saccharopolyspora ipomoeae TaxID=3042027 RepID=A0ABT6PX66_9PSEU|nr:C4-type zinc ribbon domain-containing protein [Saccharopolyspora sp. TS4A08]MDI2032600.1 C4-type zinc ribbon domain-containing protein [Saccharopolyspora sp. TS4A08]
MKADPAVQRRLLDLAEADAELNRVVHRRRTLPELEQIGAAEREVQTKRDELVVAQTAFNDLDREVKRLENEVDNVRKREARDRDLMAAGGPAKQQEELEHELQTLARRQAVLEDEQLEVMEQREALETNVTKSAEAVTEAEQQLAGIQERRDEALAELDTAEARRQQERDIIAKALPDDLIALYERVRGQRGVGVGLLQGARCGACRIELDRHALNEVREAAPDDVVRCEECGAIMVRESK